MLATTVTTIAMNTSAVEEYMRALSELVVRFGANVQPGQVVSISSEPGKEPLVRAVAEAAYRAGAKFVDVSVFDVHLKRLRALHADPDTLDYVPPWYGERVLELGELRAATIALTGPVAPRLMRDVHPELLGRDMLPRVRESTRVVNERTINWTAIPAPTAEWAKLVFPELSDDDAFARLWEQIAHVCRLDEPDPIKSWRHRLAKLASAAAKLDELNLDALRFQGPGTDLTIGLFRTSRWEAAQLTTVNGIVHAPNLPTEEVFTTPDPTRVDGAVTSTKPLFASGALIDGLRVRFEGGRAVQIDADEGAETLRTLSRRDHGASRLGEVALVDRESRIGSTGTVFYDTLLDENAASHIALGQGFEYAIDDPGERERINASELHIDFMIGSDDVAVTGVRVDGSEIPLLRDGVWQI
jgi:aminopeptidase